MLSSKQCLLVLLLATLDLVRADDGVIVIQYLVKVIILIVVLVIMAVAIYKCMKKNDDYYNDGDYTTSQTQVVPSTGITNTGYAPNPAPIPAPAPVNEYNTTQYGNPQYPAPQPTQYNQFPHQGTQYNQYPPVSHYSTANSQLSQAPPAYGHGDYDGNHQFGQFTAKY